MTLKINNLAISGFSLKIVRNFCSIEACMSLATWVANSLGLSLLLKSFHRESIYSLISRAWRLTKLVILCNCLTFEPASINISTLDKVPKAFCIATAEIISLVPIVVNSIPFFSSSFITRASSLLSFSNFSKISSSFSLLPSAFFKALFNNPLLFSLITAFHIAFSKLLALLPWVFHCPSLSFLIELPSESILYFNLSCMPFLTLFNLSSLFLK